MREEEVFQLRAMLALQQIIQTQQEKLNFLLISRLPTIRAVIFWDCLSNGLVGQERQMVLRGTVISLGKGCITWFSQ